MFHGPAKFLQSFRLFTFGPLGDGVSRILDSEIVFFLSGENTGICVFRVSDNMLTICKFTQEQHQR